MVTALNNAALAHDGMDVVRIDASPGSPSGGPAPSIRTTVGVPSVVEFWYRSRDLNGLTTLGRNDREAAVAGLWNQARWLQWPQSSLEIQNLGPVGGQPLYVDEMVVRPASQVSLAEALDYPGFSGEGDPGEGVAGFAESWLAPDGVDAVALGGTLRANLTGPAFYTFRSQGGGATPAVSVSPVGGVRVPSLSGGDRTWVYIPVTGDYRFFPTAPASGSGMVSQVPVALDALAPAVVVPINEALDAPALTFTITNGYASGITTASDSPDGDALLVLKPVEGVDAPAEVSMIVPGPGTIRFSTRGSGWWSRSGETGVTKFDSGTWVVRETPVYRSGEVLTWSCGSGGFWLDAVSFHAEGPNSVAGLLNAPGLISEVLIPAWLGAVEGTSPSDPALSVVPQTQGTGEPVLRLHFTGASVVSLEIRDSTRKAMVRIDGGSWQSPLNLEGQPFLAVVPDSGPHTLELTGAAVLDRFSAIPLISVPLPEALDAPGLTFTTSADTPWAAYRMPEGLPFRGNHAAIGGSHAVPGDPWIETQVTGPGILTASVSIHAAGQNTPLTPYSYPKQYVDGIPVDPYFALPEIWIGAGTHTVRWQQIGSQAYTGSGTTVALDAVNFTPSGQITFNDALETNGRAWAIGGDGAVTPVAWPSQSPDGVDIVLMRTDSPTNAPWLETTVQLPCKVSFRGRGIQVSIGSANGLFALNNASGFSSVEGTIPGAGSARIRFTALQALAVLDTVSLLQPTVGMLPEVNLGTPGVNWKLYGSIPWQTITNESGGPDFHRGPLGQPYWMEAVVNGPGLLSASQVIVLPDRGDRMLFGGYLPWPGPQRVLVRLPADWEIRQDSYRTTPALADWKITPGLTWTTGGEVPWQATLSGTARSGPLLPGETSWIAAAVTGPGILSWTTQPRQDNEILARMTCDGIPVPSDRDGVLHLAAGAHSIRWMTFSPLGTARNANSPLILTDAVFLPQPENSVSAVLSSGTLNFVERISPMYPAGQSAAWSWPFPDGWEIVNDPDLPGLCLRGSSASYPLVPLMPAPGTITGLLRMSGTPLPDDHTAYPAPAAAAPFPWNVATFSTFPQRPGFMTSVAQLAFTPLTPVTVGEALDQPGLTWTVASDPPGLWQSLTDPTSNSADPDGLYLVGAGMGDLATVETTVTGPLDLTMELETATREPIGLRLLLDGQLVGTDAQLGVLNFPGMIYRPLRVPAGTHRIRWEISPPQPLLSNPAAVLRRISTVTPVTALPDVPALLDMPALVWGAAGLNLTALTTGTKDGVDALGLGSGGGVFTVSLTGPGMASFFMRGVGSGTALLLDTVAIPATAGSPAAWIGYQIPIPSGRHTLAFQGASAQSALDQFSFTSLPNLTPEAALDAPAGTTVTVPDPGRIGAAAWPALSEDGIDSLLLMPGQDQRISLKVPPLSTVSLRVRAVFGTGSFAFQDLASTSISTTWSTKGFATGSEGGQTSVYLRASTVPVLLDKLVVTTPDPDSNYFTWASNAGLTTSQWSLIQDPESDGLTNFTEYAFGLDPATADAGRTATETTPGLPDTRLFKDADGKTYLEVLYWRRSSTASVVETATEPSGTALLGESGGWSAADNPPSSTPFPGGWTRLLWRSPAPVSPGERQFARVRVWLQ